MASNRKIWKTRKVVQVVFIAILLLVLFVLIYDKEKEGVSVPTQYVLNDKLSASFEYHIKTEKDAYSSDTSKYVNSAENDDVREKVSFKGNLSFFFYMKIHLGNIYEANLFVVSS